MFHFRLGPYPPPNPLCGRGTKKRPFFCGFPYKIFSKIPDIWLNLGRIPDVWGIKSAEYKRGMVYIIQNIMVGVGGWSKWTLYTPGIPEIFGRIPENWQNIWQGTGYLENKLGKNRYQISRIKRFRSVPDIWQYFQQIWPTSGYPVHLLFSLLQ